jgi:short-subunit dehydrogenase
MALPEPSETSTALVTGASSGIGAAIAESLARRGHGLTLVARREDRLTELGSRLHDDHGIRAGVIACDLAEPAERDRLAAEIEKIGLDVEVLVNNAGFGSSGDFIGADRERQVEMVRVNCETVVDLSGRYAPEMARRGRGAIINVASMAAFQPLPGQTTYAATKAFLLSFTEALHHELKGAGVTVSAVCPGPVRTEFMDAAGIERADNTPGFIWTTSEHVAEDAVKAAEAGKRAVVPGRMMNAGALLGRYSPRKIVLPLSHRIWSRVE